MSRTLGDSARGGALIKVNANIVLRMHPLYLISEFFKRVKSALCPLNPDFLILRNCVHGFDHWVHSWAVPCGHLCETCLTKGGVFFLQGNAAGTIRQSSQQLLHLANLLPASCDSMRSHIWATQGSGNFLKLVQSRAQITGVRGLGRQRLLHLLHLPHLLWQISGFLFSKLKKKKKRIPKRWGKKNVLFHPPPRLFCLFVFTSFLLLFSIGDICGENSIVLKYQGMLQSEKKKRVVYISPEILVLWLDAVTGEILSSPFWWKVRIYFSFMKDGIIH